MKPPPRNRTKPDRTVIPDPATSRGHLSGQWPRVEQRILLKALKTHSRYTRGGLDDLDYNYLRKHLPTRSITEITSVVDYLKDKVISLANYKLRKKRWEQKKARKPIEVWRHMASAMAGTLEEPITSAFSQMLIVSSTEPRTLRNCDPPQVYRPPTDKDRPVGRTVPFRPMPRLPVKVEGPGSNTARPVVVLKTPGPTMGPAKRLPAPSQVVRVANSKIIPPPQKQVSHTAGTSPATTTLTTTTTTSSQSAASSCQPGVAETLNAPASSPQPASQTGTPVTGRVVPSSGSAAVVKTQSVGGSLIRTTQQPSEKPPTTTTTCTSKSTSSGPHTSSSSSASAGKTPVPSTAASSGASSLARPTPPPSTPAAAFHAKFGRTGKYATKDSPRLFGVKSVVDFERIYRYLSVIHQPNEECRLTPMESAIVLDLLMSLPEELPLLDCNKLHKHLIKMYQFLSSTADSSKTAGEMFKELKDGLCDPTPSGRDGNRTNGQQQNAADGGGKKPQPDAAERQSSGSGNASGQPGDADEMGLCPPLNPFMVPLKLLMRK
ncbi:snRNA-activating protein complex subunit 2 [Sebastes umbrosus]|uniref:snRNA-activating protein complex subunit 2 n=1 Tax=Sebastes umbrosus TaxID=72105 RepID=UPI0018A11272|nr:snRNA-activating protein complex subunit 2 [Sebastes umbrosus]